MMFYKKSLTALCLSTLYINSVFAAEISGTLTNQNAQVINNAEIKVRGFSITTTTNNAGKYKLTLPQGSFTIDIEAGNQGHFHQQINVTDENQTIDISMPVHFDEVVVVAANPLEHTRLDMATPTIVLSGDELAMKRSSTLGDILEQQPGISMSSFGPAVARPVIRGLAGARVLMTTNQMTVQDASTTSNDHDISIEPLLAEQIEVLKGPATLLYGSGAIGGIVNVTDKRINAYGGDGIKGGVEMRLADTATGEQSIIATLNAGDENFVWHLDAYKSETDDIEIPSAAESEILHASEADPSEPEPENTGILDNSYAETKGGAIGATWNGDWGYFGAAINQTEKLYGIPGEGHAHEEDPNQPELEEEETVAIDMQQTRIDLQASLTEPFDGFDEWFIAYSNTDYEHQELEGTEIGTVFTNDASELKTFLKHSSVDSWRGIIGLQWINRDFKAIGDEAFVPASKTQTQALFILEEKQFNNLKLELGARVEQQSIDVTGYSTIDETAYSLSAGYVMDVHETNKFAVNLTRAERIPTVEEYYSFGEHLATQTFEVGNPNLTNESALNIDISYRLVGDSVNGEINAYWNKFSDFIYGAYLENNGEIVDLNGNLQTIDDDFPIVAYNQRDADIRGIELMFDWQLTSTADYDLTLGIQADMIEAEFDDSSEIPRIPPWKTGINLHFDQQNFSSDLSMTHYAKQDKISAGELPTDAFIKVDFELGYNIVTESYDLLLFFKAKNLLDEEARDHASFLKDFAPRTGRSFVIGARYQF